MHFACPLAPAKKERSNPATLRVASGAVAKVRQLFNNNHIKSIPSSPTPAGESFPHLPAALP